MTLLARRIVREPANLAGRCATQFRELNPSQAAYAV